tara:strand:- start:1360 stop:1626 length:267 start_codon:yes stop_codon:yes gene_type:complete
MESDIKNYEQFYESTREFVTNHPSALTQEERAVVLFRVALEQGSEALGVQHACFVMSKLLTITLGIAAGEESLTFESWLHSCGNGTKH